MKKRVWALLLAVVMIVSVFAACGNGNSASSSSQADTSSASSEASTATESSEASQATESTGGWEDNVVVGLEGSPEDYSEPYSFTVYYNYQGWTKSWGQDEASQYMSKKFNIDVNWYGPDSDPDAKLNLMMSSDDLPESVVVNRDDKLIKLANGGFLQPMQNFMYDGNLFEKFIAPATIDLLKTTLDNGEQYNYGIPNWARTTATGGNYTWMFDKKIYEELGDDVQFTTLETIHDYMLKVKEASPTSYTGMDVFPWLMTQDVRNCAYYVWWPIYRALGAPNIVDTLYSQSDATIKFCLDDDVFLKALQYANTWYNEGLFSAEVFSDSHDQFLEKVTNGRAAVLWYDYSQDDGENFRRTVLENSGGEDDYLVLGSEFFQIDSPLNPGLEGATYIFGDENGTVGWNVNTVTTKAGEHGQRIFDLWSWMISDEGSVNMMYGPEGGTMLKSVDYSGEWPDVTLTKDSSDFTAAENDATGAWFWSQPANADYVDNIKFNYNDTLPEEKRNWTVSLQAHMHSYGAGGVIRTGQKFITDQNTGITDVIDPQSDLGVAHQQILDYAVQQMPKIVMASTEDEFNSLIEDLRTFAHNNMVDDICAAYQEKWDSNVEIQGFNAYDPAYDVYQNPEI